MYLLDHALMSVCIILVYSTLCDRCACDCCALELVKVALVILLLICLRGALRIQSLVPFLNCVTGILECWLAPVVSTHQAIYQPHFVPSSRTPIHPLTSEGNNDNDVCRSANPKTTRRPHLIYSTTKIRTDVRLSTRL